MMVDGDGECDGGMDMNRERPCLLTFLCRKTNQLKISDQTSTKLKNIVPKITIGNETTCRLVAHRETNMAPWAIWLLFYL